MVLATKLPSAVGTGAYLPGAPGGVGGPGGAPAPGFNTVTGQGTGWEVVVVAAPDFHTVIARIPAQVITSMTFTKMLKDKGSGTVTLSMDDPFWNAVTLPNGQPAHYLLDWQHLWQVWQDGVLRFDFTGETVTEQLVDQSEQRIATLTGPGTLATLAWAVAMPPGFPAIIYKLDAITDGFSEIDVNGNPVLDTGLWNASSSSGVALNPLGTCQLTGSSGTTFLGSTIYDATETLISAQVTPMVSPTPSGATLDGSQVTQMYVQDLAKGYYALFGMSATALYCAYSGPTGSSTHVIASSTAYTTEQSGNAGYTYWQITETGGWFYFWTSPDGTTWTKQWQIQHTSWTPTKVGVYFSAKYDAANAASATVTSINSDVTTSSLAGAMFMTQPIMSVWLQELQTAQARGTVPFVAPGGFSTATDSFGNPWTDSQSVQIQNGTDLLTLLQGHAGMINADYLMQPGFRLQVGIPAATGKITLGTDRSKQVIFRDGMDCSAKVRTRARNQIANLLAAINSDGRTVTASDATSISEYGQREAWVQAAAQVTQADLQVVAAASVQQNSTEVLSWTLQVTPYLPGRTIFTGYDVGDWVGLERPDFSAVDAVRVVAISVQVGADGSETHELTLSSYIQFIEAQLTYIATKMGGGFISAAGTTAIANNAALTNQNQPTVFAPTLAGLGDVSASGSNSGTPLVYDAVTGQWLAAGAANPVTGASTPVAISGAGGTVTVAGDGSGVSVTSAPSTPADVGSAGAAPGSKIGIFSTVITDATGTPRTIIGAQTDGSYTAQDVNGAAPATPDAPTMSGTLNGVLIAWDGKLGGAAPKADFLWTEVHLSTASGFTPSTATLQGTLNTGGTMPIAGLTVGTTYYARLVARNTSGVASATSGQASAVPTSLTSSLIGNVGVLNANPYFAGGDGSTWAGVSGTFSVSSSPPAGSPYAYAGFFSITSAGVGAAAKESGTGGAFAVTAGAQYLATCWAYTGTTSVVLGFDWYTGANGTGSLISSGVQTFAVSANSWTACTTVQTAPATAKSAVLRVAPADGSGNTIYFQAMLALPQVPGSLVQAGTITATQIAAATITAAQIAANTITAAQIAANTITASQIAASTITGAQIAAGTITASNISSGTITAGLLSAGIVVAGIVNSTTVQAAQYLATGTSGQFLAYSGTPASGNLLNAIAGASGSDSMGNSWPQGLLSQQLTLQNQSSAPPAWAGGSVLYSSVAGRPRYLSQAGNDSVLERSVVNVASFTVGNVTAFNTCSATMTYLANEGNQSSEFEIEIDGVATTANTGQTAQTLSFALFVDGLILGGQFTVGAVFLPVGNKGFSYTVRMRLSIQATGVTGMCNVTADGQMCAQSVNVGSSTSPVPTVAVGAQSGPGKTFNSATAHTIDIRAAWGANSTGQGLTTYRTKLARRM